MEIEPDFSLLCPVTVTGFFRARDDSSVGSLRGGSVVMIEFFHDLRLTCFSPFPRAVSVTVSHVLGPHSRGPGTFLFDQGFSARVGGEDFPFFPLPF